MKKFYSVRLQKACCLLSMMLLILGAHFSAVGQKQITLPRGTNIHNAAAYSNAGQITASRNVKAADGRDLTVSVTGKMPAGATMSATPVSRSAKKGKQVYCAYDISISKDGQHWQPQAGHPALVSIEDPTFVDGQLMDVWHEGANGLEFVATVAPVNGKITFPAQSFSVYIVTQTGDYARLKVNFHQADGTIVSIYVKKADIANYFNAIVYDPGIGTLATGVQFRGWTANASYDVENIDEGMTFAMVRDSIRNRLNEGVTDGTVLDFYTMLFKSYSVMYLNDHNAVAGADEVLFRYDDPNPQKSYTVNTAFTPGDNTHNFEGWKVYSGGSNILEHDSANQNYPNGTTITISDDVVFSVNLSEGHWLIYHENGRGATYKSADFVRSGQRTQEPTLTMTRNGYRFVGWFLGAPATEGGDPTGVGFTFGRQLNDNTDVYAKWESNADADYTVIIWKQNVSGSGWDYDTAITLHGSVNTTINTVSSQGSGDGAYASINGVNFTGTVNGHDYTGFHLDRFDENVTINTEGNAVLNVYYDRNKHTLQFQVRGGYVYTESSNGQYGFVDGQYVQLNITTNTVYTYNNGTKTYTGNYFYRTTTGDREPQYGIVNGNVVELTRQWQGGVIFGEYHWYYNGQEYLDTRYQRSESYSNGNNGYRYGFVNGGMVLLTPTQVTTVSYNDQPYTGTRYNRTYNNGWVTIKEITALYGQNIGDNFPIVGTNGTTYSNYLWRPSWSSSSADFFVYIDVMPNLDETYYGYNAGASHMDMNYYVEALPDESVDLTYHGVDYHLYRYVYAAGYQIATEAEDFIDLLGYVKNESNPVFVNGVISNSSYANFFYLLKKYTINFMDGAYYDGGNNRLSEIGSQGQLQTVSNIAYHADVSSYNSFTPSAAQAGFVFEGWYMDATCTQPYTFGTMPEGGITVYAKWRQIQYRVFLHPNADHIGDLTWGSTSQQMNFRVNYGGQVSAPTGYSNNYEFVGWYTNAACTQAFNEEAFVLNEQTVTTPYNKNVDFTEGMDKWGNNATSNGDLDRFWITKKFELYGKWRAKLGGADGIAVVYDANGGDPYSVPEETYLYQDNVDAVAGDPCEYIDSTKEFSHWVLQRYNTTTGAYEDIPGSIVFPGAAFTVLKSNAKMWVTAWYNPANTSDVYQDTFDSTSLTAPDGTHTEYSATYTVKLRAEYVDVELQTPTFIVWLLNDGSGDTVRADGLGTGPYPTLAINEAVVIPTPTRTGYVFKGWYNLNVPQGSTPPDTILRCTPNFLYYKNNTYYRNVACGAADTASRVAADEVNPYDYLYAVWEPEVEFDLDNVCENGTMMLPMTTIYDVTLTGTWSATTGSVSGTTYTAPSTAESDILTFTPDASTCATSKTFTITVKPMLDLAYSDQSANYCHNASPVTPLTVTVTGGNNTGYQWYHNNVAIAGATANSYTPSTAVTVATITVYDDYELTHSEQSANYCHNATAVTPLTVTVTGGNNTAYQWYRNNELIAGANTNSYTPSTATVGDSVYSVKVTNDCHADSVTQRDGGDDPRV